MIYKLNIRKCTLGEESSEGFNLEFSFRGISFQQFPVGRTPSSSDGTIAMVCLINWEDANSLLLSDSDALANGGHKLIIPICYFIIYTSDKDREFINSK